MADELRLNRINKFYGGTVHGDRDRQTGVCLNVEEVDIFSNPNWIEPETIFATDTGIARKITGYTVADNDTGYAYGVSSDGDAEVWSLATISVDNPGNWATFNESANDVHPNGNIIWHGWADETSHLYYPTISGTTVTLRKLLISGPTETSVGTLSGLDGTRDRIPMLRANGELYIGNGGLISKIDDSGAFSEAAFTLPTGWEAVSLDVISDEMFILCRSTEVSKNISKIFLWDLTSSTGFTDEINIPMGGPQIVINHSEIIRVVCAKSGESKIFELLGKLPIETHRLENVSEETDAQPIVPDQSKFIRDNILYFGLWKTDKTGLYAVGKTGARLPTALVLSRRFDTSDYSKHKPQAANAFGPNFFCAFDDNGSADFARIEGNNSPTRSSNAVYESIWVDSDTPETIKEWSGFFVTTKPLPDDCTVTIDARVDNATSYDTNATKVLTNTDDQTHSGGNANTSWFRVWTSVVGRVIQVKISFTSSTTTKATVYLVSFLSRETKLV